MFLFGPSQKGHVEVVKLLLDEPWMVSLGGFLSNGIPKWPWVLENWTVGGLKQ